MEIGKNKVVTIEYTLKNDAGEVLDSSEGGEPLLYMHGSGSLIPGLEKALDGKTAGDAVKVSIPPAEGYGSRNEKLVRNVPIRKLGEKKVVVGKRYPVSTEGGPQLVLVTAVKGDYVTIDANHPLADMTLHFDVTIKTVRDATTEEISHGHAHDGHGHHHHG